MKTPSCSKNKPAKAHNAKKLEATSHCEALIENLNDHPLSHLQNKYGIKPFEFPVTTED